MTERPHFIVELWKRQPLGLLLQGFAFLALGAICYVVEAEVETGVWPHRLGLVAVPALAVGMILTHRAAFRLQKERNAEKSTRSPAPWDK